MKRNYWEYVHPLENLPGKSKQAIYRCTLCGTEKPVYVHLFKSDRTLSCRPCSVRRRNRKEWLLQNQNGEKVKVYDLKKFCTARKIDYRTLMRTQAHIPKHTKRNFTRDEHGNKWWILKKLS